MEEFMHLTAEEKNQIKRHQMDTGDVQVWNYAKGIWQRKNEGDYFSPYLTYRIKPKEENIMTKDDLILGKHVLTVDVGAFGSAQYLYLQPNLFVRVEHGKKFTGWNRDIDWEDVLEVHEMKPKDDRFEFLGNEYMTKVYERDLEVKELTMAELEAELGYKVKVVK